MVSTLSKRQCFFALFKHFIRNDLESTNQCKSMHFQELKVMFRVTLKGKSEIDKI